MKQPALLLSQFNSDLLTPRESEVLALLAQAHLSNRDIADQLFLAPNSVKWYIRKIYEKLGVNDRRQAIVRASELGLLGNSAPLSQAVNHLPVQLTPFIGREKDIKEISQMLAEPELRLITLMGTGGVGKTRLALKVAEKNQEKYPQGVWAIELSSLSQEHLVPQRTAAVFDLPGNENRETLRVLKDFLRSSRLLLILDSCEHLINACANMVEFLLQNCPHLQIMATSREALRVSGEIIYQVPPLEIPDPEGNLDVNQIILTEAVQLFENRAIAVKSNFRVSQRNQRTVAYICNRLDGIPLALELAAARLRALEIEQIADYLQSDFRILSGGGRTVPLRHQTMTASIDWSYKLLSAAEQCMLQKLSIFNGGWALEAAQQVCGEATVSDTEVIDLISQLIDKSLIIFAQKKIPSTEKFGENDLPERYHMLEPIQQFAREKLKENGDEPHISDRHLSYFLVMAEKAEPLFRGPDQVMWLNRLEAEIDNFRIALAWALETNPEAELRLCSALIWFWHIRGGWTEGLEWLCKGLQYPSDFIQYLPPQKNTETEPISSWVRAKSLNAAGFLKSNILIQQNDVKPFEQVFALFQESLEIFRQLRPQNSSGMAFALLQLAQSAANQVETNEVTTWANQSLSLYREEKDWFGISECLLILANNEPNPARAKEAFEEAIKIKRRIKDIDGLAFTCADASSLSIFEGDYEQADMYLHESLNHFENVGNQSYIARVLNRIAWLYWIRGDVLEALASIERTLKICQRNSLSSTYAQNLLLRGKIYLSLEKGEEARLDYLEALSIGQDHNHPLVMITASQFLGEVAWLQGDHATAMKFLESALAIDRVIGSQSITAGLLYLWGCIKLSCSDLDAGKALLLESVEKYHKLHLWRHWGYLAYPLEALARIAIREQKFELAARLCANAVRLFPLLYNTLSPSEREQRENALCQIKTALSEETFTRLWQAEHHTPLDQMVEYVLSNESQE